MQCRRAQVSHVTNEKSHTCSSSPPERSGMQHNLISGLVPCMAGMLYIMQSDFVFSSHSSLLHDVIIARIT